MFQNFTLPSKRGNFHELTFLIRVKYQFFFHYQDSHEFWTKMELDESYQSSRVGNTLTLKDLKNFILNAKNLKTI